MMIALKRMFEFKQVRFLAVGGANTLLTYALYSLLIYAGAHYFVAISAAYVLGIINGFMWNKFYTFKSRNKAGGEFIRYVLVYLFGLLISVFVLYLMIDCFEINSYMAGAVNIIFITVLSWTGHRYFSFKK